MRHCRKLPDGCRGDSEGLMAQCSSRVSLDFGLMKRTLIVGDVHGCREELEALLEVASLDDTDDLVFVGDLVARGPDSLGVIDLAIRRQARAVIGNHERRLLEIRDSESQGGERVSLSAGYRQLLEELKPEHWTYIRAMPIYLELPQHHALVVHAGLLPGVPIERQDPWVLTHIRSVESSGEASSRLGRESWATRYMGPTHVVFGHSAQVGIQLLDHATGLDSGCVYGKRLTGLLLEAEQPIAAVAERGRSLVSVAARRVHHVPRG